MCWVILMCHYSEPVDMWQDFTRNLRPSATNLWCPSSIQGWGLLLEEAAVGEYRTVDVDHVVGEDLAGEALSVGA